MMSANPNRKAAAPWGRVGAMLAACFATIAGLVRGIDPEVILWRAAVAAFIVGSCTVLACTAAQWVHRRVSTK